MKNGNTGRAPTAKTSVTLRRVESGLQRTARFGSIPLFPCYLGGPGPGKILLVAEELHVIKNWCARGVDGARLQQPSWAQTLTRELVVAQGQARRGSTL